MPWVAVPYPLNPAPYKAVIPNQYLPHVGVINGTTGAVIDLDCKAGVSSESDEVLKSWLDKL